ncbi:DUF2254 family protein [Nitrosomonas mobilis]|uniref:Uncharacterized protein n=1 Tax=Nitrosomonas mobilis TaxID=51642 RepID=A0A1G5SFA1_9PROT|nr:hypothetical protein NSMM_400135 [Nitrosomonas mobilis]
MLGVFAGIFVYCLIVLHTIRGGIDEAEFVSNLAVFFVFVLFVISLLSLRELLRLLIGYF